MNTVAPQLPPDAPSGAVVFLGEARDRERAGRIADAIARYESAIATAERSGDRAVLSEALRRLAILQHHRADSARARELSRRAYEVAREMSHDLLAAEALNTMGGLELATGSLQDARQVLFRALDLGGGHRELRARVEQNLGILANIQGDLPEALARYERSLGAYRDSGDDHGCAIAYHNLGMVSVDRQRYDAAECYFQESRVLAERTGDVYLCGLCFVHHAEVDVARQRFDRARQSAERALTIFEELGARGPKADAYRVIGMVFRETGRPALAESRLRSAIDLAAAAGSVLGEAEASRELALLHQTMGRNLEALRLLSVAHRLFHQLDARMDLIHVGGKIEEFKATYLAVVREWGRSIEASDRYTFGHCERVAENAVAMARALGLGEEEETTILLGAYLHDLGKLQIPHEILHKAEAPTRVELELVQLHPIWGVEMLGDVAFPWDLKAVVRWHHEHYDGSGYPDRLKGDEIPISAQIVGILDLYDSLTTPRLKQPTLTVDQAVRRITECRHWWSERVVEAFLAIVASRAHRDRRATAPAVGPPHRPDLTR